MASTRQTLEQIGNHLDESMGVRQVDARPKLSPLVSRKDVGRRPLRSFGRVDISMVAPDRDQPRSAFSEEGIQRLAQSIREKGQLLPIRVRWSSQLEKWQIISGERRWRATKAAELSTIDCYFQDEELTESEILEQQLVENLLREDLKPIEEARAFSSLMELNDWNGKQVAEALRVTPSKVSRSLALLDLPEEIQARVDAGQLAARSAYELSKIADPPSQQALAQTATAGKLTHQQAAAAVRQRRGKRKPKPRGIKQTFFAEGGWKVVVSANKKGSYHEIELALMQTLEEVRLYIANGRQLF
jgi:ParB family chromosome partitioning protein